ncbi:hypothetical protein CDAR_509971, partial [Caerostris darwini]
MWEAPLDEPPCGFDGTGCIDPPNHTREITSGVLLFLTISLSVLCWIMYKSANQDNMPHTVMTPHDPLTDAKNARIHGREILKR